MNHAGYIIGAYAATALTLAGLVAWIVLDGRALRRALGELEAKGMRRRSAAVERERVMG